MPQTAQQLRDDALRIWRAGVAAVDSALLVRETVRVEGSTLHVGDEEIDLRNVGKIAVVGAGKAGAGMVAGLEAALGDQLMAAKCVRGWINVPADCLRPSKRIHLHAARPAGQNEPTEEGLAGSLEILRIVDSLATDDLCLCLISGGGSALLPAPVEGVSLADKQAVTRHLSAAGANIRELNIVRKQLSRIKGGGLARACRAGRLIALIISDVLGDPLDVIASGPTVVDTSTPAEALSVLRNFRAADAGISPAIFAYLASAAALRSAPTCQVTTVVIGNNARAVDAAGMEAERLGYSHAMASATEPEGAADDVGRHLARMALSMRKSAGPNCLISGGEPVVTLADAAIRGLGGRNQQLALAALVELAPSNSRGCVVLSGGTDGEDGPTDAAGALVDEQVISEARALGLDASDYLRRNDAYHYFGTTGGLIKTGPTHTNVCDLRVVLVERDENR